jgi:hypothetical protein
LLLLLFFVTPKKKKMDIPAYFVSIWIICVLGDKMLQTPVLVSNTEVGWRSRLEMVYRSHEKNNEPNVERVVDCLSKYIEAHTDDGSVIFRVTNRNTYTITDRDFKHIPGVSRRLNLETVNAVWNLLDQSPYIRVRKSDDGLAVEISWF